MDIYIYIGIFIISGKCIYEYLLFQVNDLLNPNQRSHLAVRWSSNKGFYVENLFVVECEEMDDLLAVLEEGMP